MSFFLDIATRLAERGFRVMPLLPREKRAFLEDWPTQAALANRSKIVEWGELYPDHNVGVVATSGGLCVLDDDNGVLADRIEKETGGAIPSTFTVKTAKGFHYYFKHSLKSMLLGNAKLAGAYDFQADRKYVVGPGSVHPTGVIYEVVNAASLVEIPDWLVAWMESNSGGQKQPKSKLTEADSAGPTLHPDFDARDFIAHYELAGEWDDDCRKFHMPCPFKGDWHTTDGGRKIDARCTTIFWDKANNLLGFNCQATTCEGSSKTIGGLRDFLNDTHDPYDKPIWVQPELVLPYGLVEDASYAKEPESEPHAEPEDDEPSGGLQYPELAFPRDRILYEGSNLKFLVDWAAKGGDGTPDILDPGLVTEAMLTLASGLPQADEMLEMRLVRDSVLLAVSRGGKGMSWARAIETLGLVKGREYDYYDPSGHVQMIYALGDTVSGKKPNQTRTPGPRRMVWITEELSGCLKMAKSDGSKIMQQLLQFHDRNTFTHTDTKTGRVCNMDCRLSWGTCLAVGYGRIEERKFSSTFTDVSNDGLIGRLMFGFSEKEVDPRDLLGWEPPVAKTTKTIEGVGDDVFVFESYEGGEGSKIAAHAVTGWEDGVFDAFRVCQMRSGLAFPGWPYALHKNIIHIALANLHENVTMQDYDAALAYTEWQGALRKVFLASQADDDKQAKFNERMIRALRKEDQRIAKKGRPVGKRVINVKRVAEQQGWALAGKSLSLRSTVLELVAFGILTTEMMLDERGNEVQNANRVEMNHKRTECWCGEGHDV
jgi:hypothetical protein